MDGKPMPIYCALLEGIRTRGDALLFPAVEMAAAYLDLNFQIGSEAGNLQNACKLPEVIKNIRWIAWLKTDVRI